jgi:hypothetical protein
MKIRSGFVSNSSSSSFIIKGTKYKKDDLISLFKLEDKPRRFGDKNDVIYDYFSNYFSNTKLEIEDTRDYFDGEETDDVVIGKHIGSMEDGCISTIPESNDEEIKKLLEEAGLPVPDKLEIFVQFISNDNYMIRFQ